MLFMIGLIISKATVYGQTEISGIINNYSAVESIVDVNSVTVTDPEFFHPGDTVLLIQMKGFSIETSPPEYYGRQQDINDAGNYEFLLISDISGKTVTFTRELINSYTSVETVQLVRVRGYESATVTGTLEAKAWDGVTGGVLALIATNTLRLEANIDLSGTGFRGGIPVMRLDNECAVSDPDTYENFSFPAGSDKAGKKGEGPVTWYLEGEDTLSVENVIVHGRGRMATGGGGGNGRFAGGGGGSNSGSGGFGGRESESCPDLVSEEEPGGYGGYWLVDHLFDAGGLFLNRFFMGGGGGGSTGFEERTATPGGNGGGLVIIIANHLESTDGYGIYADGVSVLTPSTAGAGGGGGGGTIVASIDHYHGTVNISAKGGKGGDVDHAEKAGAGGGGGGGSVIHSGESLSPSISLSLGPGASGTNLRQNDPFGSTTGGPGAEIEELEILLNGLLFNGIRTERYTICEETAPDILEGTQPRGGRPEYIYSWSKRNGGDVWSPIDGAAGKDYQPEILYETTDFIRVVTDQDPDPVIDTSNIITIVIQPKIEGNIISDHQTICEGSTPAEITGPPLTEGGTGDFSYLWIQNRVSEPWTEAVDVNSQLNYNPPPLYDTTWYSRIATSGVCIDSSNIVPVNVHPSIRNNYLGQDQTICHGDIPLPIVAPEEPAGGLGTGTYNFMWESRSDGSWEIIAGNYDPSHAPDRLFATSNFRRTVESGECADTSSTYTVFVLPPISGNDISGSQIICYLTQPELFTGSEPSGGDGIFNYTWELSGGDDMWATAEGGSDQKDYLSPPLSDTTFFRRIIFSGSGDACKDTSDFVSVKFHPFSYAQLMESHDTICTGSQSELSFLLSGQGDWNIVFSDGNNEFSAGNINSAEYSISLTPASDDSITYNYQLVSLVDGFGCRAPDENLGGAATIRVYGYPVPDPGYDIEICGPRIQLNATPSIGRGNWESSLPETIFIPHENTSDPAATVSSFGTHTFRWTETNWKCAANAEISVTFFEQPEKAISGTDQDLSFVFETHMAAMLPEHMPSSYGIWEIVAGSGNIIFPDDPETFLTGLGFGENILRWTVYNGVCEPVSDLVTITVNDLQIPNAFSPNNSGLNDSFIISGLENSRFNEITVFNRQGNVVYKTQDYRNDWDGRNYNGEPLPEDTYYFILNVDNSYSYKGFIIIKR